MPRPAIIRTTLLGPTGIRPLLRALAARAGCPIVSTRVGGGRHVEDPIAGGPFVTRRAVRASRHPSLTRWAILRSAFVDALLGAEGVNLVAETVDLDADSGGTWPANPDEDPSAD